MTYILKPIHTEATVAGARARLQDYIARTYHYPVYRGAPPPGTPTLLSDLEVALKVGDPASIYESLSTEGWLDGWVTWDKLSEERRTSFIEVVNGVR